MQDNGNTYTAFNQSDLSGANFSNLTFDHVRFLSSNMTATNFTTAQFLEGNFLGSDVSAATLTGATWSNTLCPDGTNSDANGGTCIDHLVP